jgi:hypothetical protein
MAQSYTPINVTASTLTVDRDSHVNTVVNLDRAGGVTVTLPAAVGSGDVYRFYVKTTFTASATIAALTTDVMQGAIIVSTTNTAGTVATSATSDKLVMNGSTQGGLIGSYVEVRDVVSGAWVVTGALVATGAFATPFSAT